MGDAGGRQGDRRRPSTYTLPRLAEISGIDYRTLHNWQKRGLLSPSAQRANGSGTTNLFATEDALQILMLAELRKAGVEMRVLEAAAPLLRELAAELDDDKVVVIGEEVEVLADPRELERRIADSSPLLVFRPARVRQALEGSGPLSEAA